MTREEFSNMLVKTREMCGIKKTNFSIENKIPFSKIMRIESGKCNFNINFIFEYLDKLEYRIYIVDSNNNERKICSNESFIKWLKIKRGSTLTQDDLAKMINVARQTISNAESFTTTLTVDTFLKILDSLNCRIVIKKK